VDAAVFCPPPALPHILAHIVNAATPDPLREIELLCPIDAPISRTPIVRDGTLRLEGLFNVFDPSIPVACPCVFKASGWAQRSLSIKELLRMFDTPLAMDNVLIADRRARNVMRRSITPTVHDENKTDETGREVEADLKEREIVWRSGWRCRTPIVRVEGTNYPERTRWKAETGQLMAHNFTTPRPSEPAHESITPRPAARELVTKLKQEHDTPSLPERVLFAKPTDTPSLPERDLFAKLKQEHNLAKAVKSDNAEVPVDLWDQAVCRAPPSEVEKKALTVVRDFMLAGYRRRFWLDARKYLQVTHGKDWCHSRHTRVLEDLAAIHDILWRAASNTWF